MAARQEALKPLDMGNDVRAQTRPLLHGDAAVGVGHNRGFHGYTPVRPSGDAGTSPEDMARYFWDAVSRMLGRTDTLPA